MKKNIIFGMLVSLLAIPTMNAQVQTLYSDGGTGAKPQHYTAGSYISVGLGLAGSGMATTSDRVFNEIGGPSYNASLRYTYFMFNYMGITTGLDFSSYTATLGLQGRYTWPAVTDMGMAYTRISHFADGYSSWKELENLYMLEVPIALTFKYKPNKVGFIGTAGIKLGFPVAANYKSSGTVNIRNYYQSLNVKEMEGPHVTLNAQYEEDTRKYDKSMWQGINGQLFAEFGALFQVHPRMDLSVSVYGNYGLNNVIKANDAFGFASAKNNLNTDIAPMAEYKGLMGTAVDHVNIWSVGGKIALHINVRKLSDEQLIDASYMAPDVVFVYDTVPQVVTEIVHDTVTITREKVVDYTNAWVLEKQGAIFFRVGDAKRPMCSPENYIDILASALTTNRNAKINIDGRASYEGNAEFNQKLSEDRANKIADMLRARGVKDEQMVIQGLGSSKNVESDNPEDHVRDRRVDIIPVKR